MVISCADAIDITIDCERFILKGARESVVKSDVMACCAGSEVI